MRVFPRVPGAPSLVSTPNIPLAQDNFKNPRSRKPRDLGHPWDRCFREQRQTWGTRGLVLVGAWQGGRLGIGTRASGFPNCTLGGVAVSKPVKIVGIVVAVIIVLLL